MAATPSTCSRPPARWHWCPTIFRSVDAAPLHVRRRHHVQLSSQQRRASRRRGCRGRHRRSRPSRLFNTPPDGLQNRRHRARKRRRAAGPATRRALSHRQQDARPRGGTAKARRRKGDPRHRHQRRRDEGRRWAASAFTAGSWSSAPCPRSKWIRCNYSSSNQSVTGWYSGTSIDSEDTLNFSVLSGVRLHERSLSRSIAWLKPTII